jgi:drug/metabolite transporter (DMT)-like permease
LTAPKVAGALLGLIGLAVILNPTSIDWTNTNVLVGAGMVILAAISWAANIIYIRAHRWIASPLQLLIWQVLVATIILTVSALVTDGLPHAEWSWKLVLLFLYSGLIGTALAYWAMSMVNKSISALTTALGTTGTPLVVIAAALIVSGIGLATLGDRLLRRQATASG